MDDTSVEKRKDQHLAIVRERDVAFHETGTLLDGVGLVHEALPDLSLHEVDTTVKLFGKRLQAPLFVAGMTGGSAQAESINLQLAALAEELGVGFGLGSQRAMLVDPALTKTYQVRTVAPTALVLGNLGMVQAREMPTDAIRRMLETVDADALCVHLNPAMEIVQPEGDRDFRGGLDTFERLVRELDRPVIAKETGCGISDATARRLRSVGVAHVDVSGAGGTSWVAVETERAAGNSRSLGKLLREWGIPTAASVAMTRRGGMETVIATGGIQNGLDVARAIVLGANAAGIARFVLRALSDGGSAGARGYVGQVVSELRAVMLLVGARDVASMRTVPHTLDHRLQRWLELTA